MSYSCTDIEKRMKMERCFSCGGSFINLHGPVHAYMKSSPGCWAAYGNLLAMEYENSSLFQVHQLTVDSYAIQHPGGQDSQSVKSVGFHLARLFLYFRVNEFKNKKKRTNTIDHFRNKQLSILEVC